MKTVIHVGMPKCLSTLLQSKFFPYHEDIYYLGVGINSNVDYIDDEINEIFESKVIYDNELSYNRDLEKSLTIINKHKKVAEEKGFKIFLVSSEWFSFNFTPDMVDLNNKARRLCKLLGKEAEILLINRNADSFIRSLWAELVKVGYPYSFSEFIDYLYNFRDRNFLNEMSIFNQKKVWGDCFSVVMSIKVEDYRDSTGLIVNDGRYKLIDELCELFEINYPKNVDLSQVNRSLNDKELYHKLILNKKHRHDLGNLLFDHANIHRVKIALKDSVINDLYQDVKVKRLLLAQATELAKHNDEQVTYECNQGRYNWVLNALTEKKIE